MNMKCPYSLKDSTKITFIIFITDSWDIELNGKKNYFREFSYDQQEEAES